MFFCLGRGSVCSPGSWSAARGSHWSARGCCYADGPMVHEARAGSALPRVGFLPLRPFHPHPAPPPPTRDGPGAELGGSPGGAAASLHRAPGGWFTCPTRSSSPSSLALLPLHRPGQRRGVRGLFYCIYLFIYPSRSQCEFYVLITLSTRRTCARAQAASLALPPPPLPPPPPISNWPLGPFQKVNAPHPTPPHPEGPPHPNPHPICEMSAIVW